MYAIIKYILLFNLIIAQQTVDGSPHSLLNKLDNNFQIVMLPYVSNNLLLEEDTKRQPGIPYRYGYKHEVNYTSENSGTWRQTSDGGIIWKIGFQSKDAYAISFEYENFQIPDGGQLYVFTPDYEMIYGAYTHLNNTEHRRFSTPLIKGDTVIIEYYQPAEVEGEFSLQIIEIIHDYRDIMNFINEGRDWECGVNVICEEQAAYQNAINSVAFLDMGGFICSGAMVNNVRQDLTPYFLTAWHCVEAENPGTFRFYFNKEASACENTWSSLGPYAYGSDIVADSDGISFPPGSASPGADWALLLIEDEIDEDWGVFYAGWDATEDYPLISCGIHHPGGSGKKINYDDDTAYGAWWDNANHGLTHWQVNWDEGGSEGGSSGSPVFNERFQIVGQLTGGAGECGEGWPDLYGKFYYGWNWEMDPDRRMIDWLDPDYTGTLVLDGISSEINSQLDVPSEYSTIQSAVDNATNGSIIVVAPGTYSGEGNIDLNFNGKAITVMSEAGPELTIIDCNNEERAFTFNGGEDSTSVLDGFTIINGNRTEGGGIYCNLSSPTIKNCIIANCNAELGGGMYFQQSSAKLINLTTSGNNVTVAGSGMMAFDASIFLVNSIFADGYNCHLCNQNTIIYSMGPGIPDDGEGNLSGNSSDQLTNPEEGDYSLHEGSLCIDAGTADTNGDGIDDITSFEGNAPDIGAIESPYYGCSSLGDLNGDGGFNVLDIVTLSVCVLEQNCADLEYGCAGDLNGDGGYNVLDIVTLANCVLAQSCGGRVDDASEAALIKKDNQVSFEADGFIGGVHMTLTHGSDFTIEITDRALFADYLTAGNETRLLVITPETEELFSYKGEFEITEVLVANSQYEVSVDLPIAASFNLSDAYPNPFNPVTTMTLTMPVSGEITVEVYNLLGQVVATLASGYMEAITYTLTWDASEASSGVYFVQADAEGFTKTQKLMLVK